MHAPVTMTAIATAAEMIISGRCKSIAFLTGAGCRFFALRTIPAIRPCLATDILAASSHAV